MIDYYKSHHDDLEVDVDKELERYKVVCLQGLLSHQRITDSMHIPKMIKYGRKMHMPDKSSVL